MGFPISIFHYFKNSQKVANLKIKSVCAVLPSVTQKKKQNKTKQNKAKQQQQQNILELVSTLNS